MPSQPLDHPHEFHAGVWDYEANRPVVDGKIEDPITGEVRPVTEGTSFYSGPPNVDITIMNLHADASGTFRFQRAFPFERLLAHIMRVIDREGISLHALNATSYSITVVLADDLKDKGGYDKIAMEMVNGIWDSPARSYEAANIEVSI
ncbi:hypothetical protein FP744_10003155 [Trichoderma asperellum]|nr:hypothetical protein LI328DRAFT_168960 [Trichoderma asperelloides]